MTVLEFTARVDGQGPFKAKLDVTTETVDVSTINPPMIPNLAWEHTDRAGHFHAWSKEGELPTLRRTVVTVPCADDECSGEERVILSCVMCSEEVTPAYVPDENPTRFLPGRSYWEAEIRGVHLEIGNKVSVVFTAQPDGTKFFGVGSVMGQAMSTGDPVAGIAYVTKVYGNGKLARKK